MNSGLFYADKMKDFTGFYTIFQLHCCGGNNFEDYASSVWSQDSSSTVVNERDNKLPQECCNDWTRYEFETVYNYCPMYETDPGNPTPDVFHKVYRTVSHLKMVIKWYNHN